MKILWVCSFILPKVASFLGYTPSIYGGWLTGLSDDLLKRREITLAVCFPISSQKELLIGQLDNLQYFGFYQLKSKCKDNHNNADYYFKQILELFKPDVIHVFGTEHPNSFTFLKSSNNYKSVVSIQGLLSVYAKHYFASLPPKILYNYTIRDFLKNDNIAKQKQKMEKLGIREIETIKLAKHVIGRTTWDLACVKQMNPDVKYHFCNETLRSEFYKHKWDLNSCDKYSIFISQGNYPLKGLHYLLEAMPLILNQFPLAKLYIGGEDITRKKTLKEKLRYTSYAWYINKLLTRYNLIGKVVFTGPLNENLMCRRFLKSNVFVCSSSIENSPNSLGEAMILGVPCVASDVGGVSDMLIHKEEGFIYQSDAPYMLAHYICKIFENSNLTLKISKKAREHALLTHNRDKNSSELIQIYKDIIGD